MEAFPQVVFMSHEDAVFRNIKNGDLVKIWNDRGAMIIKCRLTRKIMPGVVDIPQGAWYMPDNDGIDRGGNVNILSTDRWTALAKGNAQHTIMVEIEKFNGV